MNTGKFVRKIINQSKDKKKKEGRILLIPSGVTVLNCACSDNALGAYRAGTIITMPGSSSSGKTFLTFTMFAEVCRNERFNDYELIYDDAEEALSIDIEKFFGIKTKKRVVPPKTDNKNKPIYSETIQDFKNNILYRLKNKKPFIYVLDSLDVLSSDAEMEREYKLALRAAKTTSQIKEIKGQQIADKARQIGICLRTIRQKLKKSKSLLIIIQQERANIGGGMFAPDSITSGGRAPLFYSSHQIWLKKSKAIKKNDKKIGNKCRVSILKNKLTGKERTVSFDIYNKNYGIDDIGASIDFMLGEGLWRKKKGMILNPISNGTREQLIKYIENNKKQMELIELVGQGWKAIEDSLDLNRKDKY